MKKKLFFKFFVLAAMALFTITACQNDDVNVNESGEISQAEYTAMLNTLKSKVNGVIDARVNTLTEKLNADKADLRSASGNEALQKAIIAQAIQIEGLNTFKTRAAGEIETLSTPEDCYPDNLKMALNNFNGYWNRSGLGIPIISPYSYSDDIHTVVNKFNALIEEIKRCGGSSGGVDLTPLHQRIDSLASVVQADSLFFATILGIVNGESEVLADILDQLGVLDDLKANKIPIEEGYKDLIDVYEELIAITDALDERLTQAEADILDLQERVTYIEEVEIPAIWEGISILYDYIGNVYNNLDQRVTGITFKPDYDFGPGLSSLILVRGLSEWKNIDADGNFGWQKKASGSVYKGITWLKYNISPANAEVNTESLELLYTTTTMITRSTSDPLLQIVNEDPYLITFENGVLTVPVLIHSDAYPLVQTSFDPNAKENIKVALQIKNNGITAPEEPTRPEKEPVAVRSENGEGVEADRSVVSSEYVTVWLGLFDGSIAKKEGFTAEEPTLFPTEIITADFRVKDCSETDYPRITLWVGQDKSNTVTVADSVLAVFYDQFEKQYHLPAPYFFNDHTLSYELVDLGNNANGLVTFTASNGKIDVSQQNRAAATGKTLAVLVKAKVGDAVHALGYVRVIIAGPEKELITITNNLTLPTPVIINCSAWTEFTVRNTVSTFINTHIINNATVNQKTNITTAAAFYQKYTGIEINSVGVTNSTAELPTLTAEELKTLVAFEYVKTGNPLYIKGTISNEAPLGDYTVVTTLKSDEYIPDLQITWKFSVRVPQLRPSVLLVNGQLMITLPAASPNITASYTSSLNSAFLQQSGKFNYNYLNPNGTTACPYFIAPYFIFKEVPAGYVISEDGRTVLRDGVEAAVIEETDGVFTVRLIEGPAAYGLVGSNQVKVEAKGVINGGVYVIYPAFGVVFVPPLTFTLPANVSFTNNQFAFNLYAVGMSGADIIRTWDGLTIPLKNNKETAKMLIDYYGIDYTYDETYSYGSKKLSSPLKLDLANITYASGSSNSFTTALSTLGATVTVGQFNSSDTEQYYNVLTPLRYRLAFNANGAILPNNLRISIPIKMEHRWGFTEGNLVIRVN
jgi:hypothetical protein